MATAPPSTPATPEGSPSADAPGDPAAPPLPTLDWTDPAAVEAWARELWPHVRDALSAGEDPTRRPGKRELGRRAARRLIRQAEKQITDAFTLAGIDVTKG